MFFVRNQPYPNLPLPTPSPPQPIPYSTPTPTPSPLHPSPSPPVIPRHRPAGSAKTPPSARARSRNGRLRTEWEGVEQWGEEGKGRRRWWMRKNISICTSRTTSPRNGSNRNRKLARYALFFIPPPSPFPPLMDNLAYSSPSPRPPPRLTSILLFSLIFPPLISEPHSSARTDPTRLKEFAFLGRWRPWKSCRRGFPPPPPTKVG